MLKNCPGRGDLGGLRRGPAASSPRPPPPRPPRSPAAGRCRVVEAVEPDATASDSSQPAGRVVEEAGQVVGDRVLEADVEVGGISRATATITAPVATWIWPRMALEPVGEPPPEEQQRVEHRGGADRVGEATRSRPAVKSWAAETVITPARIGPAQGT